MPVVWGEPSKILDREIANIKKAGMSVEAIISLGEGDRKIEVEMMGRNERARIRDEERQVPGENGVPRVNRPGGPRTARLDGETTGDLIRAMRARFGRFASGSRDADQFLCDATCYYLALAGRDQRIGTGLFVHVPHQFGVDPRETRDEAFVEAMATWIDSRFPQIPPKPNIQNPPPFDSDLPGRPPLFNRYSPR